MTRRETLALAALVAIPAAAQSKESNMYSELLKASLEGKKGLNFYIKGQTVGGGVTKIGDGWVEVWNQQYSRIIIKLDSVDAIAMS